MANSTKSLPEACYRAEDTVLGPVARRFTTMRELCEYVTRLTTSDWWMEQFPNATVGVHVEERSSSARFALAVGEETIAIPNSPTHRKLDFVLHELAHIATRHADGHGPIFRSALIRLVRREMGFYASVELEREYRRVMS